jgi:hypothetical protein
MTAMAKSAAERRNARKRKQQRAQTRRLGVPTSDSGAPARAGDRDAAVQQLIATGMYVDDELGFEQIVAELTLLVPAVDEDGLVTRLLGTLLGALWERGWQPADVVHVVRRSTTQRVVRLAIAAISAEAAEKSAATRAPEEWVAQLTALDAPGRLVGAEVPAVAAWRRAEGLRPLEAWHDVLRLFHGLTGLGELQHLCPPPSRWGTRRAPSRSKPAGATAADPRMLGRIRGLLAKAERTEFPDEAEALTAKAQELMTRHAIDVAVLDAEHGTPASGQVRARRVHVDNPYPEPKVRLLDAIATANGARAIWLERLGMVTVVGLPVDLDAIELLFTSLLVQATRAMTAAGRAGRERARSSSFRRAFLTSYAVRIGERLEKARGAAAEEATASRGTDLVPVLRARSEAVDDAFAAMFPEVVHRGQRRFDASGWYAGRLAAETADIATGRSPLPH